MESIFKFKCLFLVTFFFFTSYEICSAQEFFNYNAALLGKEKAVSRLKKSLDYFDTL